MTTKFFTQTITLMLFLVIGRVGYEFKKESVLYRFDNKKLG